MVAGSLTTMKKTLKCLTLSLWVALFLAAPSAVLADAPAELPSFELNLSYPQSSHPITITIRKEEGLMHDWRPGSRVTVRANVVRPGGKQ